jgi:hypothetical protein
MGRHLDDSGINPEQKQDWHQHDALIGAQLSTAISAVVALKTATTAV